MPYSACANQLSEALTEYGRLLVKRLPLLKKFLAIRLQATGFTVLSRPSAAA
jgi:hypothetical protein